MSQRTRPLSPHLQVYRPQISSVLSITHRATGVVLAAGALFLTYWLTSAAYGAEAFERTHAFFGTIPGRFMLLGYSLPVFRSSGVVVIVSSVALTLLGWSLAYMARGG